MKKIVTILLVAAILVFGYATLKKATTVEASYKIGKNGYDVIKEITLADSNNSLLAYLAYSISSPLINDSIKLEATLTQKGEFTLVNGTRYIENNIETEHHQYYIDRQNNLCIYDGIITNGVTIIGTFSEDRNTLYLNYEGGHKIPLDRI